MATKRRVTPDETTVTLQDSPQARKNRFLLALEKHFALAPSAKAAHISRDTVYAWLQDDPDFKKRFNEVRSAAIDNLESSFYQDAMRGHTRKGEVFLRAHRDEYKEERNDRFGPQQTVNVVFDNNPPPVHVAAPSPHTIVTIDNPSAMPIGEGAGVSGTPAAMLLPVTTSTVDTSEAIDGQFEAWQGE